MTIILRQIKISKETIKMRRRENHIRHEN